MIKFLVREDYNNEVVEYSENEVQALTDEIIEGADLSESYDDMLDDCNKEVEIMGMTFSPSMALYKLDEFAYNMGYNDYKDSLRSDLQDELEHMGDGESGYYYGYHVECVEDEDDYDEEEI